MQYCKACVSFPQRFNIDYCYLYFYIIDSDLFIIPICYFLLIFTVIVNNDEWSSAIGAAKKLVLSMWVYLK